MNYAFRSTSECKLTIGIRLSTARFGECRAPALVVSPLIVLMQDQREELADSEIPAAKLNSTLRRP